MLFYRTMRELEELLSGQSDDHELDVAALQLARIEAPDLRSELFLKILDGYAEELRGRVGPDSPGEVFVNEANWLLFGELGYRGNTTDYYNPRNSCLNFVISDRKGIPITLSVLYMEVARRLGRRLQGIGLPGHFVVRYVDDSFAAYLDPFNAGRVLTEADCVLMASESAGALGVSTQSVLAPVSKRQLLVRMLANLRGIYFGQKGYAKALAVLDLLIHAGVDSAEEYKQRGVVRIHLGQLRTGRADLERYLALAPEAADRAEIEAQIKRIHTWAAGLN